MIENIPTLFLGKKTRHGYYLQANTSALRCYWFCLEFILHRCASDKIQVTCQPNAGSGGTRYNFSWQRPRVLQNVRLSIRGQCGRAVRVESVVPQCDRERWPEGAITPLSEPFQQPGSGPPRVGSPLLYVLPSAYVSTLLPPHQRRQQHRVWVSLPSRFLCPVAAAIPPGRKI